MTTPNTQFQMQYRDPGEYSISEVNIKGEPAFRMYIKFKRMEYVRHDPLVTADGHIREDAKECADEFMDKIKTCIGVDDYLDRYENIIEVDGILFKIVQAKLLHIIEYLEDELRFKQSQYL